MTGATLAKSNADQVRRIRTILDGAVAGGRDARRGARDAGAQGRRPGGVLSRAASDLTIRFATADDAETSMRAMLGIAETVERTAQGEEHAGRHPPLRFRPEARIRGADCRSRRTLRRALPLLPQLLDLARRTGRLCAGSVCRAGEFRGSGVGDKTAAAAGRGDTRARRLLHPPLRRHAGIVARRPFTRGSASSIPTPSRSMPPMTRISTRWRTPIAKARGYA